MKINQIISEDLDEAPVGRLRRTGQAIGAKLGSRGAQASLSVSDDANEIKKDLSAWMRGSRIKKLTLDQFKNFLTQKGLPTDQVDTLFSDMRDKSDGTFKSGPLTNKEIDKILIKAVAKGFELTGGSAKKSRFAVPKSQATRTQAVSSEKDAINFLRSKGYKVMK